MKRVAYVLINDFVHTDKRNLPFLSKYFDYTKWQVCVFRNWDAVCAMTAPDVFLDLRDPQFNWRQDSPNWYDCDISYQVAKFVTVEGSGYVAVHAGLLNIPVDHPIRTQVLKGSVVVPAGGTPLHCNMLVGKGLPGSPFNTFTDVAFIPQSAHPILNGIKEFIVRDEQYGVELLENSDAVILGNTVSEAAGSSIGAWAREAGNGRAAGITLGHLHNTLCNPMLQKLIANAINWCGREIN